MSNMNEKNYNENYNENMKDLAPIEEIQTISDSGFSGFIKHIENIEKGIDSGDISTLEAFLFLISSLKEFRGTMSTEEEESLFFLLYSLNDLFNDTKETYPDISCHEFLDIMHDKLVEAIARAMQTEEEDNGDESTGEA